MDYITEEEYLRYKKLCQQYEGKDRFIQLPCIVCGKSSTGYHKSIIGQIKWFVCKEHLKSAYSTMGAQGIGLVSLDDPHRWLDMPFLDQQQQILQENGYGY